MSYFANLAGKIERVLCHAVPGAGQGLRHGHQHADGRVRAIVPYNFPLTLMETKIGPTFCAMVDATLVGPESNRGFYLVFFTF
jgi:hypothetical protein